MKRVRIAVGAAVAAVLFAAGNAAAEGEVDQVKEMVNKFIDINAMVATTFTYNTNEPFSGFDNYNVINKKDDSFVLYDAFLQISRNRADEDFGFTVNMDFGETAKFTASDWDGSGTIGDSSFENSNFQVREAYGTYKLPWDGIKIKAGKFVTLLGYEVLMTNTAFNPNISHSILFGFGIPFTHTGLIANVAAGEKAWVDIGIVNGWDNAEDNNRAKTLIAGLGVKPIDLVTLYLSGTYGAEQNGEVASNCVPFQTAGIPCPGAGSKRGVVTLNGTVTPIEGLSFIMDSVYGNESNILPDATGSLTLPGSWYGLVGYVTWAPGFEEASGLSLNLRGEVFDDADGVRNANGTSNPQVAFTPQTIVEITPTIAYQFSPNILARVEYRYDHSNKNAYELNAPGSYSDHANTLAAELLVAF